MFLWPSSTKFSRFSDPCDDNSTTREIQCLLRNGIIYLPSLASPIVAFNTSSGKESSNLRNDEASDSRQSSLVTEFFSGVNEAVVVACFDSLQV